MSRVSSPVRRVLGEKDANALLSVGSPRNTAKPTMGTEKTGLVQVRSDIISSRPELLPPSLQAGRKRRINEVEGVEVQDWQESNRLSQVTDIISESGSDATVPDTSMTSMLALQSAPYTSMTSMGASQQEQNTLEPQFELPHEEMSQQTLENIHAVSVPHNTSQTHTYGIHPALVAEDTHGSVSLSSLIDFGGSDASQTSDGPHPSDSKEKSTIQHEVAATTTIDLTEEGRRKLMMAQKAAELRTRLQFAYFKVQTNQTTTPFSRLKVPESMKADSPRLQARSEVPAQRSWSTRIPHDKQTANTSPGTSPESRIAAMRAQATGQPKPKIKSLSSLPMPQIGPTAFSSRYADGQPTPEAERDEAVNIPSSPPLSQERVQAHTAAYQKLDLEHSQQRTTLSPSNDQLSSPPPSHHGTEVDGEDAEDANTTPRAKARGNSHETDTVNDSFVSTGTTNSAVKGEAADGLVQLMLGRVGSGSVQGMCGI